MGESILSRAPQTMAALTTLQTQMDSTVSSGTRQIMDVKFMMASLVGAGAAGAAVKYIGLKNNISHLVFPIVGSTAHEFTYRALEHLSGPESPSRWKIGGREGIGAGLVWSNLTFGPSLIFGSLSFFVYKDILSLATSSPPLFTKIHSVGFAPATGIIIYLGSYQPLSKGPADGIVNLLFGEGDASDTSFKKPDSSPASGK